MDLLNNVKSILNESSDFIESKNFYFEQHKCEKTGNTVNIKLNYKLSCDMTDDIILFGQCSECKVCYYHKDFQIQPF